ncbi:DUF4829 domain-containing protein [Alkalihalophilus lindianensis]|uniref:DUF4829 domain-containing protein n=1 Tax=Alkalihalophilus lindianensis TaxID=1630542 RepID=A0ABU3XCJ9_9BACI|nr:DUF4829 domain-containing protein [Alkalihalophilus lindianensis]MDV2685610.1 DUF4829 domain-containing protein [Alkalihalophilus lindianensis]
MKKTIVVISVTIFIFLFMFNIQAGKTKNVQVSIEESIKFSEEEIHDALTVVKRKFKGYRGCELTELWYDENQSNKDAKDYLIYGNGSTNGIKEENVIVLLSNFDVNASGGDGSFEPNSTESNWKWILIRDDKNDKWSVDDWGY